MAIQIGERKKKNPILIILLVLVVIGFIVFKLVIKKPEKVTSDISQSIKVGNVKSMEAAIDDINNILENTVFQQLVSHNTIDLQPTTMGKEDPFAN